MLHGSTGKQSFAAIASKFGILTAAMRTNRTSISLRNVEDILQERGIDTCLANMNVV
jgi:hypothetical protein